MQIYLRSDLYLVAIDKDHAVLAWARSQEGDALRGDVMQRSGQAGRRAGHAVACMRAGGRSVAYGSA